MKRKADKDGLVYSTGPVSQSSNDDSEAQAADNSNKQTEKIIIRFERKGRGGKTVTVLETRGIIPDRLHLLTRELKKYCGTGGTLKNTMIEIQGDQREKIRSYCEKHKIKFSG